MKKLYLFFILSYSILAQNAVLQGYVYDAITQEPLVSASIQILETKRGAATDINGKFEIKNLDVGDYRIRVSVVGYETRTIADIRLSNAKPFEIDIYLSEDVIQSEVIEVNAGYFNRIQEITTSKISLSREEIRRFPGGFEDVVRTVSTLPGISINTEQGRNDLLVRGGGPSENLFIINGLEIPNINHFGTQGSSSGTLSFINLDFIQNVEFSSGGFTAEYGDKMSSVMEIDLAKGRSDKLGGKTLISATQFGANIEGPLSKQSSFFFSARKSYLDIIFKANGFPFVPVYSDLNFSYSHQFSNNDQLFFLSVYAKDDIDKDNSDLENRIKNTTIMNNNQNQIINGLTYRRQLNSGYLDIIGSVNYLDYRFSQDDQDLREYFRSSSIEREYIAKINYLTSVSKKLTLRAGLSQKLINFSSRTTFADTINDQSGNRIARTDIGLSEKITDKFTETKRAAYFDIDYIASPSIEIKAGLRFDRYSYINEKNYLAPRFAAKFIFSDKFESKISGGTYYQSPSYIWTSNPLNKDLKALRNDMIVLSFNYFPKDDWKVTSEFYYKDYTDLPGGIQTNLNDYIVITNTGTGFGGQVNNFQGFGYFPMASKATGNAYGAELLIQKKYSETPYYGQFSLSYGKSELTAINGKTYPNQYDQRIILNLGAGYKMNRFWEFSGKFRLFTGTPFTPAYLPENNNGQLYKLPNEYLSERLGTGNKLDLRADRYFYYDHFTLILFLDIQNILNAEIPSRPRYDFFEKKIREPRAVRILPSIGVSFEF